MHHQRELLGEFLVDRLDRGVDRLGDVLAVGDRAGHRLVDEGLDQILGPVSLRLLRCGEDLVENPNLLGFRGCRTRRLCLFARTHQSSLPA